MTQFKTTSGKTVNLKPVSLEQRFECEDASPIGYDSTGAVVVHNIAKAALKWACAGLGIPTAKKLLGEDYTYDDIVEIGNEVQRLARLDPTKPHPTKPPDSDSTPG